MAKKMMKRICCISLLAILGLLAQSVSATEYYVSSTGSSDSNPGTSASPWSTISKAVSIARAGDVVSVQAGTYAGVLSTTASGTPSNPITFKTDGGIVTINGFNINHSYIRVEGFTFTGTGPGGFKGYITLASSTTGAQIVNCKIINGVPNVYGLFGKGVSNTLIQNCIFDNIAYHVIGLDTANSTIQGCTISNTHYDAMQFFGHDNKIINNLFNHIDTDQTTHSDIIQTFGTNGMSAYNILFAYNSIIDCDAQVANLSPDGVSTIRDWTFKNNVYVNVSEQANIYVSNTKWFNNVFYGCNWRNANDVLQFKNRNDGMNTANNGTVMNNIFVGCGNGTSSYGVAAGVTGFSSDYNYVVSKTFGASGLSEPHGIKSGNPGFMNISANDFHLQVTSPAINKGADLTSLLPVFTGYDVCVDKDGNATPSGGAWEMGAYEYTRGASITPSPTATPTPAPKPSPIAAADESWMVY